MEKIFCVKDSNERFGGSIRITCGETANSKCEWVHISEKIPMLGYFTKEGAELETEKLKELDLLAGFDLTWEVVEMTRDENANTIAEQVKENEKLGISRLLFQHYNYLIEFKPMKNGCIGKHRILVKEIYKKYKLMMKKMEV